MVTIKEIAQMLDVSPTTVSNVINGRTGKMSPQTRQRIEDALWENHYEVAGKSSRRGSSEENMVAAAFYMSKHGFVALDPFCAELMGAIQRELKRFGRFMIYDVPESDEDMVRLFAPWNVDGGIVLGYEPDRCEQLMKKIGKPLVFVDSYFGMEAPYDNIGLQDFEGARELTSYLLKLGHRRVAFFSDQDPPIASNLERLNGFKDALHAYGQEFSSQDFYYIPQDKNLRHEIFRQFARKNAGEYTAAFFVSDFFANEAISVFSAQGLRVPDDISVTGFDDNVYARLSRPMLTTVRQSPSEKGRRAVEMLMKRIRGEEVLLRTIQLPTELIVRDSVKNMVAL